MAATKEEIQQREKTHHAERKAKRDQELEVLRLEFGRAEKSILDAQKLDDDKLAQALA